MCLEFIILEDPETKECTHHFYPFLRRKNRGSLATFFAEEIAHLGASKNRAIFWGSGENRRRSCRESRDFGALRIATPGSNLGVIIQGPLWGRNKATLSHVSAILSHC